VGRTPADIWNKITRRRGMLLQGVAGKIKKEQISVL